MENDAPLSIESAIKLMQVAPEADKSAPAQTDKAPADAAAPASTDQSVEEKEQDAPEGDGNEAADASPAEGETDTPHDEGETNDEDVDQGDALPPIEPPSSWKAEEKEVWKSLPRAAQEAIARREQDRTNELRNLQNSAAEQRKAHDAEVARLKEITDKISTHVKNELNDLAREFPELKSEADVIALSQSDPARFSLFQAKLMKFNAARQAEADAQRELAQKAEQSKKEMLDSAKKALVEAFPTWSDPNVARKEITELQDYAISQGAPEQAARSALDPIVYKLAQKAMLYDRAQKAKADAVKRDPPRVVKPGTQSANPKGDAKARNRQAQIAKLDKSGAIEDAIGLLRA